MEVPSFAESRHQTYHHDKAQLLLSTLPWKLQLVGMKKSHIPLVAYPLLGSFLDIDQAGFFSYTEADARDVSIVLDQASLHKFQNHINALSFTSPVIRLIGPTLRAIQVLEGHDGFVDGGVIASVSGTLARALFSIFFVSTNNSDYVLVREDQLNDVIDCLHNEFRLIRDDLPNEVVIPENQNDENTASNLDYPHPSPTVNVSCSSSPLIAAINHTSLASAHESQVSIRRPRPRQCSQEIKTSVASTTFSHDNESEFALNTASSAAVSHNTLCEKQRFSAGEDELIADTRKLKLRTIPHSVSLLSFHVSAVSSIIQLLLQMIFFPVSTANNTRFFSMTVIDGSVSIICDSVSHTALSARLPHDQDGSATVFDRWIVLEAVGFFDLDEVGLVNMLSRPLSESHLNHFYFSTFRTGFVLVREEDAQAAISALAEDFDLEGQVIIHDT